MLSKKVALSLFLLQQIRNPSPDRMAVLPDMTCTTISSIGIDQLPSFSVSEAVTNDGLNSKQIDPEFSQEVIEVLNEKATNL